jgi:hypothetical protein
MLSVGGKKIPISMTDILRALNMQIYIKEDSCLA